MAQHLLKVDHPSLSDLQRAVASKARSIAVSKDNKFWEIEQQLRARDADPDDVFIDPYVEANHKAKLRTIKALEQQHQFFQSYIQDETYLLGSVFSGSGYWRTRAPQDQLRAQTIVDWALIKIRKERLGENKVSLFFLLPLGNLQSFLPSFLPSVLPSFLPSFLQSYQTDRKL